MSSQTFNVPPPAPGPTQYRVPPKGNDRDRNDVTSFVPSQADWAEDNMPPLMGQIEKLPHQTINADVPMLTQGGHPVMGNQGRPLRDFRGYLPDRICSKVEAWRLACWLSVDERCQYKDILDRMLHGALKDNPANIGSRVTSFRSKQNQPSLSNAIRRSDIQRTELNVLDQLTMEQIRHNTTWHVTPWGMVQQDPSSLANPQSAAHPFVMDTAGGSSQHHVPSDRLTRTINKLRRVRREAASKGLADWKELPERVVAMVSDLAANSEKGDVEDAEEGQRESNHGDDDGRPLSPDAQELLAGIQEDSVDKGKGVDHGIGEPTDTNMNIDPTEAEDLADAAAMQEAIYRSKLDSDRAHLQASNMGESSRAAHPAEDVFSSGDQPQPLDRTFHYSEWVEEEPTPSDTAQDGEIDRELLHPQLFQAPSPPPATRESPEQRLSPEARLAEEQSDPLREPPPFQVPNGPLLVDPLPELPRNSGPLLNRGTTFVDYSSGVPAYGAAHPVPDAPSTIRHPAIPTNEANPHPTLWYEPAGNPFIAQDGSWIEPSLYGCPYDLGDEGPRSNLDFEQWMMSVGARRYYGLVERNPNITWPQARDILKAAWEEYWMAL